MVVWSRLKGDRNRQELGSSFDSSMMKQPPESSSLATACRQSNLATSKPVDLIPFPNLNFVECFQSQSILMLNLGDPT